MGRRGACLRVRKRWGGRRRGPARVRVGPDLSEGTAPWRGSSVGGRVRKGRHPGMCAARPGTAQSPCSSPIGSLTGGPVQQHAAAAADAQPAEQAGVQQRVGHLLQQQLLLPLQAAHRRKTRVAGVASQRADLQPRTLGRGRGRRGGPRCGGGTRLQGGRAQRVAAVAPAPRRQLVLVAGPGRRRRVHLAPEHPAPVAGVKHPPADVLPSQAVTGRRCRRAAVDGAPRSRAVAPSSVPRCCYRRGRGSCSAMLLLLLLCMRLRLLLLLRCLLRMLGSQAGAAERRNSADGDRSLAAEARLRLGASDRHQRVGWRRRGGWRGLCQRCGGWCSRCCLLHSSRKPAGGAPPAAVSVKSAAVRLSPTPEPPPPHMAAGACSWQCKWADPRIL